MGTACRRRSDGNGLPMRRRMNCALSWERWQMQLGACLSNRRILLAKEVRVRFCLWA